MKKTKKSKEEQLWRFHQDIGPVLMGNGYREESPGHILPNAGESLIF